MITMSFHTSGAMSTPSLFWRISLRCHLTAPVASSRANAPVDVPPKTSPLPTATPVGPVLRSLNFLCHRGAPVARSSLKTFEFMSCR